MKEQLSAGFSPRDTWEGLALASYIYTTNDLHKNG